QPGGAGLRPPARVAPRVVDRLGPGLGGGDVQQASCAPGIAALGRVFLHGLGGGPNANAEAALAFGLGLALLAATAVAAAFRRTPPEPSPEQGRAAELSRL
ncbi:hypothetical protein AB0L65_58035, partial [Nonomuraea sp. NPDC052116]|uniref:hypothetical protein n=1 Tax=Nonomuraea sp. NPDC052116 TaxID=3155665 RepID=UPI0034331B86